VGKGWWAGGSYLQNRFAIGVARGEAAGVFSGTAVDLADGFIHFSAADQVEKQRRNLRRPINLLLVAVDAAALGGLQMGGFARRRPLSASLCAASTQVSYAHRSAAASADGLHDFRRLKDGHLRDRIAAYRLLDAETAHHATIAALNCCPVARRRRDDQVSRSTPSVSSSQPDRPRGRLRQKCRSRRRVLGFGFGFVEVGTLTPRAHRQSASARLSTHRGPRRHQSLWLQQ
jgi:hypothetical protein